MIVCLLHFIVGVTCGGIGNNNSVAVVGCAVSWTKSYWQGFETITNVLCEREQESNTGGSVV